MVHVVIHTETQQRHLLQFSLARCSQEVMISCMQQICHLGQHFGQPAPLEHMSYTRAALQCSYLAISAAASSDHRERRR